MKWMKIKNGLFLLFLLLTVVMVHGQDMKSFKLYDPNENAEKKLQKIFKQAERQGKHVFVQIGGNWCVWCARFNEFVTNDYQIDSLIKENYLVYHLNYSKENKNTELLEKYGYPQRFGFPVFLILNEKGERLHTQDSGLLESGSSYDKKKVMTFLENWSKKSFDPEQYKYY